jgi:sortase A
MPKRRWLFWLGSALTIGGAAFLLWYSWTLHDRNAAQRRARKQMNGAITRHKSMPAPVPAVPVPVRRGDVVAEIDIPRLDLSVMVFEGDDAGILKKGAGHIPGTALPTHSGNVGIAAHRDTFFRPLREIHANDVITLKTPGRTSRYAVTDTRIVRPSEVGVLAPAPGRDLTLVTCYPFHYVGSAPKRFIVHARKIG